MVKLLFQDRINDRGFGSAMQFGRSKELGSEHRITSGSTPTATATAFIKEISDCIDPREYHGIERRSVASLMRRSHRRTLAAETARLRNILTDRYPHLVRLEKDLG